MSKYERLGEFLKSQRTKEVPMTFAEIERVIGSKLPPNSGIRLAELTPDILIAS